MAVHAAREHAVQNCARPLGELVDFGAMAFGVGRHRIGIAVEEHREPVAPRLHTAAHELQRRDQFVQRVRDLDQDCCCADQRHDASGTDHDGLNDDEEDRRDAQRCDHQSEQHHQPRHGAPARFCADQSGKDFQ